MINNEIREVYGDFLKQFPWDWYGMLTFRKGVSPRLAFKLFNKWKVSLKKSANRRIDYILVIEPSPSRDIPHLHFLLYGVNGEKPYIWEKQWYAMAGLAKIRAYDPELGACYYLGEKIIGGTMDVIFSKDLLEVAGENGSAVLKKIR